MDYEYQTPAVTFENKRINKSNKTLYFRSAIVLFLAGILIYYLVHIFSLKPLIAKENSQTFIQYVAKEGYSFSYPAGYKVGAGRNSVDIVDDIANSNTPQSNIHARWSVEENIMAQGIGEAQAAPLVADEYTTINGVPAYRSVKQGTDGAASTVVTYQLLRDNTIYRFTCEVDDNDSQELVKTCDTIAKSFNFVK